MFGFYSKDSIVMTGTLEQCRLSMNGLLATLKNGGAKVERFSVDTDYAVVVRGTYATCYFVRPYQVK